ncbi:MAG: glycosyltransferase family 2 protein [Ruthenibacterium sp.]
MGTTQDRQQKKPQRAPQADEQDSVAKAVRRTANPAHAASLAKRAAACLVQRGPEALWREGSYRIDLMTKGESWKFRADIPLKRELRAQRKEEFDTMPLFSVVVPLYNTPLKYLRAMIKSVLRQSYTNFELVLVDASDAGHPEVTEAVKRFSDRRIVLSKLAKNEGISGNTNIALREAAGDYFALLDHDDALAPGALYEMAKAVNETGADFLYSDEIVLDGDLKKLGEYHFKPDFSPDYLRGCNYITHLSVFSRALLSRAGGGEKAQYDGAQDYDLILRLSEKAEKIVHIPKVLYYWRRHENSTASDITTKPYAIEAGAKALRAHLKRVGLAGKVTAMQQHPGAYHVEYALAQQPLVTVILPNKDHVEDLKRCLASLLRSGYPSLEILVIENNSTQKETALFYQTAVQKIPNLHVLQYKGAFNFSAINNFGAQHAHGEHLLLLNNDVELLSPGFVRELLSYSQRADVGAVGAKLYYPDDQIQHAGVFVGIGGSAGHSHKGHPRDTGGDMYRVCTTQNFCAVTGACLMVKTALYKALGGLDEKNFAIAYNDVDFCLRLRAKGLLNVMTPFAEAYHYESKSRGDDTKSGGAEQQRYEAEKARFVRKYAKLMQAGDPYYNPHFTLLYENYGYR